MLTRGQLLELGFDRNVIDRRIASGRLHPVHRGVYAVGRPELTHHGRWMAAVLACGPEAVLSHESAAALWGIRAMKGGRIEVSVPAHLSRNPSGVHVHRRADLPAQHVRKRRGIPLTSPLLTIVDLAAELPRDDLEQAISDADKRTVISPVSLRSGLERLPRMPGRKVLRDTLDPAIYTMTDTKLERLFLPIAERAGLPRPLTQQWLGRHRVDFYWPDLGLIVETDGLTYHRTPAQQTIDRIRDQTHAAAGLTPLRFTRWQVRFDPRHVEATLAAVGRRLQA